MNDYPTHDQLERIRTWDYKDPQGWFAYLQSAWHWEEYGPQEVPCEDEGYIEIWCSTGGWSGNEELIEAMRANRMLWALTVWAWRRGGHHTFRYPRIVGVKSDARR